MDVSCSAVVSSVEGWREQRMHGREAKTQGEGARWASDSDMDGRCDSGPEYI